MQAVPMQAVNSRQSTCGGPGAARNDLRNSWPRFSSCRRRHRPHPFSAAISSTTFKEHDPTNRRKTTYENVCTPSMPAPNPPLPACCRPGHGLVFFPPTSPCQCHVCCGAAPSFMSKGVSTSQVVLNHPQLRNSQLTQFEPHSHDLRSCTAHGVSIHLGQRLLRCRDVHKGQSRATCQEVLCRLAHLMARCIRDLQRGAKGLIMPQSKASYGYHAMGASQPQIWHMTKQRSGS
jgi:hypothetical protein